MESPMGDLDIEDLSSHLETKAVKLIVGTNPRQKVFVLHKQLLSTKAPVFGKMFDGRFLEGTTGEATLPEDDPDIIGVFVGWVHGKRITEAALRTNTYIELAKFSEKYCLVSLVDGAIEGLVKTFITRDLFLEMLHIEYCYENTGQNSKLRPWAARSYAYVLTHWEEEPFATDSRGTSENLYPRGPNAKESFLTAIANYDRSRGSSKARLQFLTLSWCRLVITTSMVTMLCGRISIATREREKERCTSVNVVLVGGLSKID